MTTVRESSVNGMFYPDDPVLLKKDIGAYLKGADLEPFSGRVHAIISPHAGYVYSGQVAAYAYKAVSALEFDRVIVVAPSHRAYFEGVAVWEKGSFRTPLGDIEVDARTAEELLETSAIFNVNRDVHRGEHSLEVQLPFLQYVFKDVLLLPLLMGAGTEELYEAAATALERVISARPGRSLIVASTDLSHYYPYEAAVKIDSVTVEHLKNFDVPSMIRDVRSEKAQACGAGPMITAMMAAKKLGAQGSRVLKYANSGDVSGDRSGVVGYVSAIFFDK
ncbi:MAG: AmmeMemoRadiSam system protein B [Syntrophorhabdaceae bacterium]|nr:AmmeMemoRadiSam system protein B [Syntrophorhabdaceae bacterium]